MFLDTARFPFMEVSLETKSLALSDASCKTNRLELRYVIPSTVKVPWSTIFLDTWRFPFSEASLETKSLALSDASPARNNLLFKDTSLFMTILFSTVKLPDTFTLLYKLAVFITAIDPPK